VCPNDILIIVLISLMVWELLRKSRYFRVTPRMYGSDVNEVSARFQN